MRYFERLPLDTTIQNQLSAKTSTNFGSLTDAQRNNIVAKLMAAQKSLCAYCECEISLILYHIEHFEEQHDAPNRVFDYINLLLSCEGNRHPACRPESVTDAQFRKTNISCGHRKTKGQHGNTEIDYSLLLNPTKNVAALFSYIDGIVEPRHSCTSEEKTQVEYTIKRLNLDTYRIENNRINEIDLIQKSLQGLTENEQKIYIRSLLDESQTVLNPYFSTIKDNFGFMLL
jgi:uncharacterized protein (TIGR02646 family)